MPPCTLCDLPTGPKPETAPDVDGEFCCHGCLSVSRSLDGVDDPEDLQERVPEPARVSDDVETTYLHIEGMHCSTCGLFLETVAGDQAGVTGVEASYATDTVRVDYDPETVSVETIIDRLSVAGYTACHKSDRKPETDDAEVVRFLIGGGLFGMMAMMWYVVFLYPTYIGYDPLVDLGGLDGRYLFAQIWLFASIVLFYTGRPLLRGAYVSLRARQPNMDLLVSIAAGSSYTYSTIAMALGRTDLYFDVTIAVVLVVTAGNYYESRVKRRATEVLSAATADTESTVRRASGTTVPLEEIDPGDELLVRPGERIPLDGTVSEGRAAVDASLITGESLPMTKHEGDPVRGGSVVTDTPVVIEVGDDLDSALDTIVRLMWDVQSARTGVQRLADRLATVFVPLVIVAAAATVGWHLATGTSLTAAALVGLTVLIVSCPCALGLATPLAIAAGVRDAARSGIAVVSETVFEEAPDVETVVLDKTGTLTDGEMRVLDVVSPEHPDERVLERAATLEAASPHPVAKAIVGSAADRGVDRSAERIVTPDGGTIPEPTSEHDGQPEGGSHATVDTTVLDRGVRGRVDGVETLVGHRSLFGPSEWDIPTRVHEAADRAEETGRVAVYVGWDGVVRGVAIVGDDAREEWETVLDGLSEQGKNVIVMTGDSVGAAERFAAHPAVDEVFAEMRPRAKATTVRRLAAVEQVAMIGDGSNDAPALAAADVGVSVASGTDLAADAADAVLLEDHISAIPDLFAITHGTNRRIRWNLMWALTYNAIAIPLAVSGAITPLLAALAMATSSLLVVANSIRPVAGRNVTGSS